MGDFTFLKLFLRCYAINYLVMKEAGLVFEPIADDINLVSHVEPIEFTRYFPNPCQSMDSMFQKILDNPETQHCGELISFRFFKVVLERSCQERWTEITEALIDITPRLVRVFYC